MGVEGPTRRLVGVSSATSCVRAALQCKEELHQTPKYSSQFNWLHTPFRPLSSSLIYGAHVSPVSWRRNPRGSKTCNTRSQTTNIKYSPSQNLESFLPPYSATTTLFEEIPDWTSNCPFHNTASETIGLQGCRGSHNRTQRL